MKLNMISDMICEAFHRKLNSLLFSKHPNLYVFVEILKNVQTDTYIILKSLGTRRKATNPKHAKKIVCLNSVVQNYENGILKDLDYVKKCCHHFGAISDEKKKKKNEVAES